MCTRYSLTKNKEALSKRFGVSFSESWKARYNVAAGQIMPVITNRRADEVSFFCWGLIPNWSVDESSVGTNLINAKAENILSKAPFKQAIKSQRCLILADGYFEWKRIGKNKVPYRITLSNDEIFAFAGIWDFWENAKGEIINSFSIITTTSNKLLSDINDRMPVILTLENEKKWLSDKLSDQEILSMLTPYDTEKMSYYQAHKVVNSAEYDYPECIQVAPKIYPGESFSLFE
ncbi:MAG TPA: SOS response-associated peptidase [Cytophagaceae bacterium]|jgi:putative SOS response-associated peptidase YedK|nr:SOS response-associated peptidase [Cytophagaceae bacterium]